MSEKPTIKKRWTPEHWASLAPFGIGHQRPNNYAELTRALRENAHDPGFAWRILRDGVCDGCALGTTGMKDWTLDGVHLCNIRLRLLKLNTMPALNANALGDAAALARESSATLRDRGRLPYPMLRTPGAKGFVRVSWNDALDLVAERIQKTAADRMSFYLTSRGMPNEAYYCAQKAVRAMGCNSIDNAARICHSPSTIALKETVGAGATTCSYSDWIKSDLIVFVGSNVANNQPVATKYLHYAKKNGAKIAVLNNYREPGMERYWIPSVAESALFGTKLADRFFLINVGADVAFLQGALKAMINEGWIDQHFIHEHTDGYDDVEAQLRATPWEDFESQAGVARDEIIAFARMVHEAKRAVFVWSMGVTQHTHGVDNVKAIINLALTKGFVGREGCGLMPIRGHSGVQGGAEMGAYATALPGGKAVNHTNAEALAAHWGFPVPIRRGLTAPEAIDAAHDGELDVLFSVGGNFLEVLPDPDYVQAAMKRVPLRVHMDIVLSPQMFVDSDDTVLLLPAATRYETPGGVTETSTERRVIFSPEIPGRRIGEARPEWEVFLDLARRVMPQYATHLALPDTAAVRDEIARVVPMYDGIQHLAQKGDQFQYGGDHLCADSAFGTPNGRAQFAALSLPDTGLPEGKFLLATRRGKQFNSMVQERKDAITGAPRDAIFMNQEDATRLGIEDGTRVRLTNASGNYEGRVFIAPVKPGNLQAHWPEANVLLDHRRRAPAAGVPDYNAVVALTVVA